MKNITLLDSQVFIKPNPLDVFGQEFFDDSYLQNPSWEANNMAQYGADGMGYQPSWSSKGNSPQKFCESKGYETYNINTLESVQISIVVLNG